MTGGLLSTSSTSVVIEIIIDTKLEEVRFFSTTEAAPLEW